MESKMPHHVAIIMDGNGRWGEEHYGKRTKGHFAGTLRAKEIVRTAGECGIKVLTLFAFSTENWNRPEYEINVLMKIFRTYMLREADELYSARVRVVFIGDRSMLPSELQRIMEQIEARTYHHTEHILQIAISYGSRKEILDVVKRVAREVENGTCRADEITEEYFCSRLWTAGIPDPDLVIRTGGNMRISNFLLWQCAYSEYEFVPALWPDFTPEHFREILNRYASRERRFGGIPQKAAQ